ncbi:spore cortex-lytic enzyme [Paenibacillus turpanensis]|uniref:spore cortex-lytic enzyme n=1 Tax=Paenibacillus turpanensis TaxID=2689078 RepID=UPI001408840A|nr:spore cortex-lytic enzyme [Paenibacillus turpanensis]
MNKRLVVILASLILCAVMFFQVADALNVKPTFSDAILVYGAKGKDVEELQGRLQHLGYYKGPIDGEFGWQTSRAVKDFQYKFGMKVDGVVGAKTKVKLYNATKQWRPGANQQNTAAPRQGGGGTNAGAAAGTKTQAAGGATRIASSSHRGFSEEELKIMANAVYGEARGEPYEGQVAVAAVILNRVESASFPNSPSGVIFQPGAFTAVADGQIWLTPNDRARQAVQDALNGWDPSGGCLYYFNPVTATSKWIWTRPQVKTIGKHIFCM